MNTHAHAHASTPTLTSQRFLLHDWAPMCTPKPRALTCIRAPLHPITFVLRHLACVLAFAYPITSTTLGRNKWVLCVGRDESERRRAESQWIVAARPLCHLQYPVAYLSRLQRILPIARWELRYKAAPATHPSRGLSQRHVPLGAGRPLLLVGNRAMSACVASSPDSDLEAFSHNPAHGSFAPLAFQPSAMTNCANQRFLSY